LVKATGAELLAFGKKHDKDFDLRIDRALADGDTIEGTEFGLEALHTPGHAPNHLCFLLEEERLLFTGDMVLGGTWSVINPSRGGDMAVYLEQLARIEKLRLSRLAPGHGDVIDQPKVRIQEYVAHRNEREKQILGVLKTGPARVSDIVEQLYGGQELPEQLIAAAGWQVHAHLVKLKAAGKVSGASVKSAWKLAS
jgi:hydroxyacylglutathione hydrolase